MSEVFDMASRSSPPKINYDRVYCPEAVIEWYRLTGLKDRKESLSRKDLALKAKQHLSFLNWEFWHVDKKGKWELRYTSPINGKNYISLSKACKSCIEDGGCSTAHSSTSLQVPSAIISPSPKRQEDFEKTDQSTFNEDSEAFSSIQNCNVATIYEDAGYSTIHSSTIVQVPPTTTSLSPLHFKTGSSDFGEIAQSTLNDDSEVLRSISLQNYDVTTISEVEDYSITHSSTSVQVPPTSTSSPLLHLENGWSDFGEVQVPRTTTSSSLLHLEKGSSDFGEIVQSTFNEDSQAFRSISLQKYNVTTISEDEGCSIIPSSTTVQVQPSSVTISPSPLNLKKRPRDFGEIDQSTFNEDSEVFSLDSLQKCDATTISTSKVNVKHAITSKPEVTNSLRCYKRRKVSNMSIMDKNLEGLSKNQEVPNMSVLENNSEVFGKGEEVLEMSIREGCAFISWLVKNRVLVPGTNVFCRGGNNIVKIGNIVFDGIICQCCQVNFNITGFETHAGCTRNSPSISIMLEDGRSLLACEIEALDLSLH